MFVQYTYQLKLQPSRQGRPLHCFDAVSGQPALLEITQKKRKFCKMCRKLHFHKIIPWLYMKPILATDIGWCRRQVWVTECSTHAKCHVSKCCVKITGTRSYATVVEEVLLWIFPKDSFYITSYLIFSRLLSTDSSRTSWGKRTISLSWSSCRNKANNVTVTVVLAAKYRSYHWQNIETHILYDIVWTHMIFTIFT